MAPPLPESGDTSSWGVPDGPWTQRPGWRSRQVAAEAETHSVLKTLCFLLGGVGLFALGQEGGQWMLSDGAATHTLSDAVLLGLIFIGLSATLGGFHFFEVVRARTAARGTLLLASLPVPLGGRLRGQFDTGLPARMGASARFRVRVGCYDRRRAREADGDLVSRTRTLWHEEAILLSQIDGSPPCHRVSLAFDLPQDLPATRAHTSDGSPFWRLRITPQHVLPGRPKNLFGNRILNQLAAWVQEETGRYAYRADVSLPVFDVRPSALPNAPRAPDTPAPQYAQYTAAVPTTPGITVNRTDAANLTVTFRARRTPATLAFTVGGTLAALLGTGVALTASILAALFFALAVVGFGYTAYRTLQPITLFVNADGVQVELGGLLGTSSKRIPFEQIANIRAESTTLVIEQTEAALDDQWVSADLGTPAAMLASALGLADDAVSGRLHADQKEPERTLTIHVGADPLEAKWLAEQIETAVAEARNENLS